MNPRHLRREQKKVRQAADILRSTVLPDPLVEVKGETLKSIEALADRIRAELGEAPSAAERRSNI